MGNTKYTFEDVKNEFESANCRVVSLEEDFKNVRDKIAFICGECNKYSEMMFSTFINGKPKMCRSCRVKNRTFKRATNTRYTNEIVADIYKEHGCVFLGDYTKNDISYEFICKCGRHDSKLFYQFMRVPNCRFCSKEKTANKLQYTEEYVRDYLANLGCELLGKYSGVKEELLFKCVNGHISISSFASINTYKNGRCRECANESVSGENHYNWNGGVYDDESIAFRKSYEFKQWRKDVFKRDSYKCVVCHTGGVLNAHHKDGYNWCVEKRTDVDNGVTMCEDCHNKFHSIYGRGNNTEKQFEEFCRNSANSNLLMV